MSLTLSSPSRSPHFFLLLFPTLLIAPALIAEEGEPPMNGSKPAFTLTSPAFQHNHPIPPKYTGEGQDVSPPLNWSGLPQGTVELALICDDPDAPRPEPWVHWLIWNIPAQATGLPEAIPRQAQVQLPGLGTLRQGANSWPSDNLGYRGPFPPRGHGVHHYHFRLYALDTKLDLAPGATKDQLLAAMKGHILAETVLTGTYQR